MKLSSLLNLILISALLLKIDASAETSLPVIDQAKAAVNQEGIGVTKSFLQKYFPTVELQLDMFDYKKATSGILIVAPLSNPNDTKNTFFTQNSVYHRDNRTTVNLGLGYRRLEMDNKVMLGANSFYDYEFPYGNRRTSIGLEARTTVGELNFNQYWGASNWMNAANSYQEKSLGGTDVEVGVPLPYMNWAKVYGRGFIWRGVDGANDLKGTDVSLRAQLPLLPGLAIEGGRRTYTNATPDENFLKISYNLADMSKSNPSIPWFTSKAYSLDSMENQRYNKVRRENMIMKQARSTEASVAVGSCPAGYPAGYVCTQTLGTQGSIVSDYDTTSRLNGDGSLVWATILNVGLFSAANTECNTLNTSEAAGFTSGWRLPTQQELSGLNNSGLLRSGKRVWSSTISDTGRHYGIGLYAGNVLSVSDTGQPLYLSCVH
jgi:adhesin/invasin